MTKPAFSKATISAKIRSGIFQNAVSRYYLVVFLYAIIITNIMISWVKDNYFDNNYFVILKKIVLNWIYVMELSWSNSWKTYHHLHPSIPGRHFWIHHSRDRGEHMNHSLEDYLKYFDHQYFVFQTLLMEEYEKSVLQVTLLHRSDHKKMHFSVFGEVLMKLLKKKNVSYWLQFITNSAVSKGFHSIS